MATSVTAVAASGPVAFVVTATVTPAYWPSTPSRGSWRPRTVARTCAAVGKASAIVTVRYGAAHLTLSRGSSSTTPLPVEQ